MVLDSLEDYLEASRFLGKGYVDSKRHGDCFGGRDKSDISDKSDKSE